MGLHGSKYPKETYLSVINKTNKTLMTFAKDVYYEDWCNRKRPDFNFGGRVIRSGNLLKEKQDINMNALSMFYTLILVFHMNSAIVCLIDQGIAANRPINSLGYETTYVQHDVPAVFSLMEISNYYMKSKSGGYDKGIFKCFGNVPYHVSLKVSSKTVFITCEDKHYSSNYSNW